MYVPIDMKAPTTSKQNIVNFFFLKIKHFIAVSGNFIIIFLRILYHSKSIQIESGLYIVLHGEQDHHWYTTEPNNNKIVWLLMKVQATEGHQLI